MGETMDATTTTATTNTGTVGTSLLTASCRSFEYAEMNLRHCGNVEKTTALVKRAIRMGYDSVVINIDIGGLFAEPPDSEDDPAPPPAKKKKGKGKGSGRAAEAAVIPDPFVVDESQLQLNTLQSAGKRFRQYTQYQNIDLLNENIDLLIENIDLLIINEYICSNFGRLTVTLADTSYVHQFFHSPQLRKYDIIAIRPDNEQIFTTLTRKTEFFDVITYDQTSSKIHWLHGSGKSKQVQQLADEGIGFELSYADALVDSSLRRQVLSNGRSLLGTTKGKKVFFTSAANDMIDLRAPVDAMNMLVLFGVPSKRARPYLSDNPREILLRAEAKRTLKGAIAVTTKDQVPSKNLSQKAALARLMAVPELFIQIEQVPPKVPAKDVSKDEPMETEIKTE